MDDVKAILFDLDGTLIDTEKYYQKCWPVALRTLGYEITKEQVLSMRSLGRPFAPALLKSWFGETFDYDGARAERKKLFDRCVEEEGIQPKAGAEALLQYLKQHGVIRAVVTATDPARANEYLAKSGLYGEIDALCSATEVKEGKPKPDVYLYACEKLGLKPEETLAVEDSPNGIRSAHDAGCRVIFVPDQTQDEPEAEALCFRKCRTLDEIIPLLGE